MQQGYHNQPSHDRFRQLLQAPIDDAQVCVCVVVVVLLLFFVFTQGVVYLNLITLCFKCTGDPSI